MSSNVLVCAFPERAYEDRANAELRTFPRLWWRFRRHPFYHLSTWTPSQVAEKFLGFDVAVAVQGAPPRLLGRLLDTVIPPGFDIDGLHPDVGMGSAPRLASLFFQYKRSDHVVGGKATGFGHFQRPFYRFRIDKAQHKQLEGLASASEGQALVRYVAPLFHTDQELIHNTTHRRVLSESRFIDVITLSHINQQHSFAAFDATEAVLCSEPESIASETLNSFFSLMGLLEGAPPEEHIRLLGDAVRGLTDDPNPESEGGALANFAMISEFAARNRLYWMMLLISSGKGS